MVINRTSKQRVGAAAGGLFVLVLATCVGGALGGGAGLFHMYGESQLGAVAAFAAMSALVVGSHSAVCCWAYVTRPGPVRLVVAHVPWLMTYLVFAVRWPDPWWPLGYLGWAWAALAAAGVLTAWWLGGSRGRGRGSLVYALVMVVLLGGNTMALGWHIWTRTRGFGLVGELSPEAAVRALEATSCLSETGRWYHDAGVMVEADCPDGESYSLRYQGVHDDAFDTLITNAQPRQAFARWWMVQDTYRYHVVLGLWSQGRRAQGSAVVLTYRVEWASDGRFMPGDRRFELDRASETWTVTVVQVAMGGWKVDRIDVPEPIQVADRGFTR
ncbi:hypothetical protein QEZ54_35445 [Catellatospora sp. KI3]|uniref:hypothetical protein n=1 Tax=Catellatospora sp. KI3 TaxID=3041620 RepID=UPI0024831C90|nr:hypothetical protein [Catellatospora sp. KI3]MDI1466286.1 hypothetical protein [Catellatospora sp. KI3]